MFLGECEGIHCSQRGCTPSILDAQIISDAPDILGPPRFHRQRTAEEQQVSRLYCFHVST